ncbi:MAG: choice-of-anchor D domain-containing protein [Candidatus Levyibacteriota bacterium]
MQCFHRHSRRESTRLLGSYRGLAVLVLAALSATPMTSTAQAARPISPADHGGGAHAFFTPEVMRQRGFFPPGLLHAPGASQTQGEKSGQGALLYHTGSVMRDVTNYVIIWNPPPANPPTATAPLFGATYQQSIEQYFKDVGSTPFSDIYTQYGDSTGFPVPSSSHFGGTWVDTTNAYPHTGTVTDPLVGTDIQAEVTRAIAANPTWQPPGLSTMYFVYLGQNIIECFQGLSSTFGCFDGKDWQGNTLPRPSGNPNTVKGAGTYCAYHSSFPLNGSNVIYATMPYAGSSTNCGSQSAYPNGRDQDLVLSPTSHEQFEAYTDPNLDAWYDATGTGGEIGDKCAYTYGQVEPDGTTSVLSGPRYQVQEEWSNALTYGCIKRAGPDPQLAINGDLDFGVVPRGTVASKYVIIQNTSGGDLDLLNLRITNAGSAYSIDPSSPLWGTLPAGESASILVNFAPSATASSSFVAANGLTVDTDQIGFETQAIPTSATIGLPQAAVTAGLNFGTVCSGSTVDQTLTVTNTGQAPLTISSVAIGGAATVGLSVLPTPSLPQTLAVGASLTFTVRFTPTGSSGGPIAGSVVVTSDDPTNASISVPISGNVGVGTATLSSNALDFGGVATDNRTSPNMADRTVTIGNTGSCSLSLGSASIAGTNAGDFTIVGAPALPVSIASASSLTLTLRFNPSAAGARSATLQLGTSDPAHPSQSVALTGTGLVPAIQTSATALAFGPTVIQSQAPGYAGATMGLSITNVGQSELIVDSMTAGSPFSAPAAMSPPARYAPSDGFNEPVTFAPTTVGKYSGTFAIADTDPEGSATKSVPLCGEAVLRGIRVLAVDVHGTPFASVSKLHLQSHGTAQNINVNAQNLPLVAVTTSCDPTAQMQYQNQPLPATGTVNQRSSYYTLAVTAGGKSTTVTFTLDVAEFKTLVVTVK